MRDLLARAAAAASGVGLAVSACQPVAYRSAASVEFESASVWIVHGRDSTRLSVEVAGSRREQEVGLSGRSSLPPDHGMLFVFDRERSGEEGFWMVDTEMPLDIAFIDDGGVIRKILAMDVCDQAAAGDDCPGYFPGLPYRSALEVNRGWFAERGIAVGARVRMSG